MKCPIKLSPDVLEFIESRDLIYVGVGNRSRPILAGKGIGSFCVTKEGGCDPLDRLSNNSGSLSDAHYFVSRPDAKKHFPHCLPKARKTSKDRYFRLKTLDAWTNGVVLHQIRADGRNFEIFKDRTVRDYAGTRLQDDKDLIKYLLANTWEEISLAKANAYLDSFGKPPKTEAETLREENASLKARIAELESEKEKLRAAIRALNNF